MDGANLFCDVCWRLIKPSCVDQGHIVACGKCGLSYRPKENKQCHGCYGSRLPIQYRPWTHREQMEWLKKNEARYGHWTREKYLERANREILERWKDEVLATAMVDRRADAKWRKDLIERGNGFRHWDGYEQLEYIALRNIKDSEASLDATLSAARDIIFYIGEIEPEYAEAVHALRKLREKRREKLKIFPALRRDFDGEESD
ncbi:hypothetical protein BDW62DRAFT_204051 [Aspergillus aurantiobrunneus]